MTKLLISKKVLRSVKSKLGACLRELGFAEGDKLTYFRLRDDFVDVVRVWHGAAPGKLYMAHFVNLLADPRGKLLKSWIVGERPGKNPHSGVIWLADNEDELNQVVGDMCDYAGSLLLDYFDAITLNTFVEQVRHRGSMFNTPECIALVLLGEEAQVPDLCQADLQKQEEMGDLLSDEHRTKVVGLASRLLEASENNALAALIEEWRQENLKRLDIN